MGPADVWEESFATRAGVPTEAELRPRKRAATRCRWKTREKLTLKFGVANRLVKGRQSTQTNLPVLSGFSTPTASTLTSISLASAAAFSFLRLEDMFFSRFRCREVYDRALARLGVAQMRLR